MRWVMNFSLVCVGLFILACGVMWSLGVFSGLGLNATVGAVFGTFLATAMGTALMALTSYSNRSGHDASVQYAEDERSASWNSSANWAHVDARWSRTKPRVAVTI